MKLVQTHIINNNHSLWKECDDICFKSKNVYNSGLYLIKKQYEENGKYLNYHEINKNFVINNNEAYRTLKAKVSQQTLMMLDKNFKSFFNALKEYAKFPNKFTAIPQSPKYKHKINGRYIAVFTQQTISKKDFKSGNLTLSGTNIKLTTKINFNNIQQIRIIPLRTKSYKIEIIYEKQEKQLIENDYLCGIDVGLNNLFTISFNSVEKQNLIIKGNALKSINQYYNKKKARLQSKLKNNQKISKQILRLTEKRNNKIKDYIHKCTKILVDKLKQNNISKVAIGKNDQWKQDINIGKKNNQNFVSVPHAMAINILIYKLKMEGIDCKLHEESYTSKCSAYDLEKIGKHDVYLGKRIKRGLFETKSGKVINADSNGGYNIMRKVFPRELCSDGIEGLLVNPMVLTINQYN